MGSLQNYLKQKLNSHLLRTTTYTRPTTLYLALFTTKPDKTGANGTEVSTTDTGYNRIECGPLDASWSDPDTNGKSINLVDFAFSTPTADWGTPVAFGIADAATAGNLLIVESLVEQIEVLSGSLPPKFAAGDLWITWE